jgi:hypothetical protein
MSTRRPDKAWPALVAKGRPVPGGSEDKAAFAVASNLADKRDSVNQEPHPCPKTPPLGGENKDRAPEGRTGALARSRGARGSHEREGQAPKSSRAGGSASNAGARSRGNSDCGGGRAAWKFGASVGSPRCSRIRGTPALDVTAATIAMRPEQRVHARASSKNTRQISDAHGNLAVR